MATVTKAAGPSVVTARQLQDALARANAACLAYTQPVEVRPGVRLCAAGRVMRAMHIANQQPPERRAMLDAELTKLAAAADEKLLAWVEAERAYRGLCEAAGVTPDAVLPGEACDCEGCQLAQAAAVHIERPEDTRLPLPRERWCAFSSFAEAQVRMADLAQEFRCAVGFDRTTNRYVVVAAPGA